MNQLQWVWYMIDMETTVYVNKAVRARYEELRKNPVFFLKSFEDVQYNINGDMIDGFIWKSLDSGLNISVTEQEFANRDLGYALCILDGCQDKVVDDNGNVNPNVIVINFHCLSPTIVDDWVTIINCFINRSQCQEDKYAFMELLWALDKLSWDKTTLISALSRYHKSIIPFLVGEFQKFGRALSYNKQQVLRDVLTAYNGNYNVYSPDIIRQAYNCFCVESDQYLNQRSPNYDSLNLYTIVDKIFSNSRLLVKNEEDVLLNPLMQLYFWLNGNYQLDDYTPIVEVSPLLPEKLRMQIVKRYFHDIRTNHTSFDINIIMEIKDSRYSDFIRYRYCIERPCEPVDLTVPLLCDTLITLNNSNGNSFQTFDGVMDFAMTRCDIAHPAIDFGLQHIIPTCKGGAVYNSRFKGFIDYALIRKLNEGLMTDEHLRETLVCLMDKYARRQEYPICCYGDGSKIPDDIFDNCRKQRECCDTKSGQKFSFTLECFRYQQYNDRWTVRDEEMKHIRDYMQDNSIQRSSEYNISLNDLSISKLKSYIMSLPQKFVQLQDGEFLVNSYNRQELDGNFDLYLIQEFSDTLRMRIFPQQGALVGLEFDVFGYLKEDKQSVLLELWRNSGRTEFSPALKEYEEKESQEVRKRCIDSLSKELNTDITTDGYFEIPYDRGLLSDMLKRFYFKGTMGKDEGFTQREFLTCYNQRDRFALFCSPELSNATNPAIGLPYFWCRGRECFHNSLDAQTLEEENNWMNYTLFHLTEILGFPKLHRTVAGYEPDSSVSQFVAIANKAMKKFERLKCRACGHMLFSERIAAFNRYNHYKCMNPICADIGSSVYLNYCYKCKKGLIDSRDTKQCPNYWYICPDCLACCDDDLYERLAQRYILENQPVPKRIDRKRGQGHNDKGLYYCPKCGGPIMEISDESGNNFRECPVCHIKYHMDFQYRRIWSPTQS